MKKVFVIALNSEKQILLTRDVKRFSIRVKEGDKSIEEEKNLFYYNLPNGEIKEGQTAEEAARQLLLKKIKSAFYAEKTIALAPAGMETHEDIFPQEYIVYGFVPTNDTSDDSEDSVWLSEMEAMFRVDSQVNFGRSFKDGAFITNSSIDKLAIAHMENILHR